MLEHDPLIPNNLARLDAIHDAVLPSRLGTRLDYAHHILLQVLDDLALHETQEALQEHLDRLSRAYRRAAVSYSRESNGKPDELNHILWRMASLASRIRLESWIYRSRHGAPPARPRAEMTARPPAPRSS